MNLTRNECSHLLNVLLDYIKRPDYLEETQFIIDGEPVTTIAMVGKLGEGALGQNAITFPDYPTDIDTPETLLVTAKVMYDHSLSISAFDWAVVLKQIQAALFWCSVVKKQMEDKANEELRDNQREKGTN